MKCEIFIITNKSDLTTDYLVKRLYKRDIPFFRFNTEDFPTSFTTSVLFDKNTLQLNLNTLNKNLEFDSIKGIWYRRPILPSFENVELLKKDKEFAVRESSEYLLNLWSVLEDKNWVNNPFVLRIVERKIFQLCKAKSIGFNVPETLISNDSVQIKSFYNNYEKQVVAKPLSSGDYDNGNFAIYANDLSEHETALNFKQSFLSPYIIQEKIEKVLDIRTIVIGEQIFSFELHLPSNTKILDWRNLNPDQLSYKYIDTPEIIKLNIFQYMSLLNIKFGAFDFALDQNNNWIFFEINPNGQWAWLEMMTNVNLTDPLIDLLLEGK